MKKLLLFAAFPCLLLVACNSKQSPKQGTDTQNTSTTVSTDQQGTHAMLGVKGSCDMCKSRIEKAALDTKGVTSATWDSKDQQLHVNFDASQTSIDAISKAVAKVGHDTDKDKADQATYDALPGCCKYRK